MLGPLRVSQLLSIVIFVACAVIMAVGIARAPRVGASLAESGETETPDDAKDRESTLFSPEETADGEVNDSEEDNENGKDN